MDFVSDSLYDGRRFRALTVVDNFSHVSQAIEIWPSLIGQRVVAVLERLRVSHGLPDLITVGPSSQFNSRALDDGLIGVA